MTIFAPYTRLSAWECRGSMSRISVAEVASCVFWPVMDSDEQSSHEKSAKMVSKQRKMKAFQWSYYPRSLWSPFPGVTRPKSSKCQLNKRADKVESQLSNVRMIQSRIKLSIPCWMKTSSLLLISPGLCLSHPSIQAKVLIWSSVCQWPTTWLNREMSVCGKVKTGYNDISYSSSILNMMNCDMISAGQRELGDTGPLESLNARVSGTCCSVVIWRENSDVIY